MENLSGLLLTQSKKIATKEWKKQRKKKGNYVLKDKNLVVEIVWISLRLGDKGQIREYSIEIYWKLKCVYPIAQQTSTSDLIGKNNN